jgi:hypothetical protein
VEPEVGLRMAACMMLAAVCALLAWWGMEGPAWAVGISILLIGLSETAPD